MKISLSKHLSSPFSSQILMNGHMQTFSLSREEKIKTIVFSILIGLGTALVGGIIAFYAISAFYKSKKIQLIEDSKAQPLPSHIHPNPEYFKNTKVELKEITKTLENVWPEQRGEIPLLNKNEKFSSWLENEYRPESMIRKNIENLIQTENLPFEEAQFIGVRGNGDCTMRSLGVGLLMEALRDKGIKNFSAEIKATHRTLLEAAKEKNDPRLKKIIDQFEKTSVELSQQLDQLLRESNSNTLETVSRACINENFDRQMILYLRACASLQTALLYLPLEGKEETVMEPWFLLLFEQANSYEKDILSYLEDKLKHDPNNNSLHGNFVDAYALSKVLNQPIYWVMPGERGSYQTVLRCEGPQEKRPIYLFNRPGHTDLILTK